MHILNSPYKMDTKNKQSKAENGVSSLNTQILIELWEIILICSLSK